MILTLGFLNNQSSVWQFFVQIIIGCGVNQVLNLAKSECRECPRSTYKFNNTYCIACPDGQTTNSEGAHNSFECYGK